MTREEIIELAQKCQLIGMRPHLDGIYEASLERFAELVAAKERERCAQIADAGKYGATLNLKTGLVTCNCSETIRSLK